MLILGEKKNQVFLFSLIPILMLMRDWKFYSKASANMRALEVRLGRIEWTCFFFVPTFEILSNQLPSNYTVMVNGLPPRIRAVSDPKLADRLLADAYRPYMGDDVEYAHVAGPSSRDIAVQKHLTVSATLSA